MVTWSLEAALALPHGATQGHQMLGVSGVHVAAWLRLCGHLFHVQGVGALLLDEFHERSLDADTALALALDCQAWTRPELRWVREPSCARNCTRVCTTPLQACAAFYNGVRTTGTGVCTIFGQSTVVECNVTQHMPLTLWPLHSAAARCPLVCAGWLSCLPHWVGGWLRLCSNLWQAVKQQMLVLAAVVAAAAAAQSL
jgi:hypothetical protein